MSDLALTHLLVVPRLRVQNANAISSPMTHGFPAMTAFLGLLWALERKLQQVGVDVQLNAIGVVCHDHQAQVTEGGYIKALRLTRNPVNKAGDTAAIVEEGRIHLEVSLVIGINVEDWRDDYFAPVMDTLLGMRIAGGSILPQAKPWLRRYQPWVVDLTGGEKDKAVNFRKLSRALLPGYALVAREDLLDKRLQELQAENSQANRLDAWLSLSRSNWRYCEGDQKNNGRWEHDRKGWLVPIPIGYGALSELYPPGAVTNARDNTTPFRFVESLYSIGEWVSPHRLSSPQQLLWYVDSQPENGLYLCRNDYLTQPFSTPVPN